MSVWTCRPLAANATVLCINNLESYVGPPEKTFTYKLLVVVMAEINICVLLLVCFFYVTNQHIYIFIDDSSKNASLALVT